MVQLEMLAPLRLEFGLTRKWVGSGQSWGIAALEGKAGGGGVRGRIEWVGWVE